MANFTKPPALRPGDTVATVSSSWGGPGTFPHRYEAGKQQLQEEFDLTVVEMPHALKPREWVAQNPRARAEDLMQAFADPSIKGIISSIGGDDSIRLLPYLDLEVIRRNPKVFVGYSDTTVSHFVCLKSGIVSFYGPSIMSGFAENTGLHQYLVDSFRTVVFEAKPAGRIAPNTNGWTVEMLNWEKPENQSIKRTLSPCTGWHWLQGQEVREGRLIGGCLEVIDWLRGSNVWPARDIWKDAIVFLETSEEAPSPEAVRRMLRAMVATGALDECAAVLVGRPGGFRNPHSVEDYDKVFVDVLRTELDREDLPLVTNMDFGHTDPIMTIPLGVKARVDCQKREFSILEAAVR